LNWPLVELGEVIDFIRGVTFKPGDLVENFSNASIVVMRTKNVQVAGLKVDDLISIPKNLVRREEQILKNGDMLISSANSWALVGKVSLINDLNYECTAGGFISIVRPISRVVDSQYLYHWISAPKNQDAIRHCGRQTTNISNLDVGRFKTLKIPLPPLAEQKRIADILDKADGMRRKRQQAIDLADEFLRATFLDMFGDPFNNIMGFPKMRLDSFGSVFTGNTPPRSEKKYYGDYIDWIKSNNIHESSLYVSRAKEFLSTEGAAIGRRVPSGSILVTCIAGSRDSIGNTALTDRPVAFNQQINALVPTDPNKTLFIYQQLNLHKELVRERSIGVTTGQVNKTTFSSIELLDPPEELVVDFTRRISQLNMLFHQFKDSTRGINECFNSLQHKAFAGEL